MEINKFLEQFVEGYLFCDIENMIKIELKKPEVYGACGYQIIMATLSGMELLGGLLDKNTFDLTRGNDYFANYWSNYFCKYEPKYKIVGIEKYIRKLIRHGLAHVSLTKPGIFITKNNSSIHWKFYKEDRTLAIDVKEFYNDFKKSYYEIVRVNKKNEIIMQTRLNEMIDQYQRESDEAFDKISQNNLPQFGKNIISAMYNASTMHSTAFTQLTPSSGSPSNNENQNFLKKLSQ